MCTIFFCLNLSFINILFVSDDEKTCFFVFNASQRQKTIIEDINTSKILFQSDCMNHEHQEVIAAPGQNIIQPQQQAQPRPPTIQEDPFAPSYPQSAIQYLPYRIGIVVFAVFMIVIGKSSLPSDSVPCIQDVILDGLQPVTNFYIANEGLGLTLVSIMQLIVDIQLVLVLVYWFVWGDSLRYPLVLTIIGISKILLNVLFQTKAIENSFTKQAFPSIVFGSNFANTYFFSGVSCLLMLNLLEFYEKWHKNMFRIQIGILIYVIFVLMSMRQNFFMDIATALIFTHYVYYFINDRIETIDRFVFKVYDKIAGKSEDQDKSAKENERKYRSQDEH